MEALDGKGWVLVDSLIYQGLPGSQRRPPPRDQTAANHQKQDENAQCSAEAGESDECHKTE
jgi:hypothetical protein